MNIIRSLVLCTVFSGLALTAQAQSLMEQGQDAKEAGDFARAADLFEQSCQANGPEEGCMDAAYALQRLDDPAHNDRIAANLSAACTASVYGACSRLGGFYHNLFEASGDEEDLKSAVRVLGSSCKQGDNETCGLLMVYLKENEDLAFDRGWLADTLKVGCAEGANEACFEFGIFAASAASTPQQYALASEALSKACQDEGYMFATSALEACTQLGQIKRTGKDGDKSTTAAFDYFSMACTPGEQVGLGGSNPRACFFLGDMLTTGEAAGLKDQARAKAAFTEACNLEFEPACARL